MKNKKSSISTLSNITKYLLTAKTIIGVFLVGIGTYAAYTIIQIVYYIFTDVDSVPFMKQAISLSKETINLITDGNNKIEISNTVLTYVVAIILLMIASRLAARIIKVGADMISKLTLTDFYEKLLREIKNKKEIKESEKAENKESTNRFI